MSGANMALKDNVVQKMITIFHYTSGPQREQKKVLCSADTQKNVLCEKGSNPHQGCCIRWEGPYKTMQQLLSAKSRSDFTSMPLGETMAD